jgi:hypothetical protein
MPEMLKSGRDIKPIFQMKVIDVLTCWRLCLILAGEMLSEVKTVMNG